MTQQQAVLLREADLPRADRGNGASTTRLVNQSCGSQSMMFFLERFYLSVMQVAEVGTRR